MKPRILPIILTLVGVAGLLLFMLMPVMTSSAKFVETASDTDLRVSWIVYYNGSSALVMKGMDTGIEIDIKLKIEQGDLDTLFPGITEEYPDITIYLCFIGLGVAILGMLFSIFGGNAGLRIIGALLCLAGAGMAITGGFLLWNFNQQFQAETNDFFEALSTSSSIPLSSRYATFGIGWFAAVGSMGLFTLSSIFLMVVKPKRF